MTTQMSEAEKFLARNCYGYGCWSACYWFIGPEQGMGNTNYEEEINKRYKAFIELQTDGLCDCRSFHEHIGGNKFFPKGPSQKVALNKTWGYQIALLYAYLDKYCDREIRRDYQFNQLGNAKGHTCVVELKGLPAYNGRASKDQTDYLGDRIKELRKQIDFHSPKFVVFYGSEQESWTQIANCEIELEKPVARGDTVFTYMPHPNARNEPRKHTDWEAMGKTIRSRRASPADYN
jgi:hypothetical protein